MLIIVILFIYNRKEINWYHKSVIHQLVSQITLDGSYDKEKKQVYLFWNLDNSENYLYTCFQKKPNESEFQTISTTSFNEDEYIKVLNIYPDAGNNLASWMNNYGMGIMKVSEVTLSNFNSNYDSYLKDSSGNWKYDVLVFGFWDANNYQDLTAESASAVANFIDAGKGCIFGHDTISLASGYLYHPNFASLAHYVNISNRGYWTDNGTTSVYLTKTGIFTSYPWYIGEAGTYLTIPTSHNLDQTANGDIWIKFNNDVLTDNQNFYLTTWNNCAMIQTGHSNGAATVHEQKILANLIFYTNQLTSHTYMYDYTAIDIYKPDKVSGLNQILKADSIEICFNQPEDKSSIYTYYIKGTPKLDNLNDVYSNEIQVEAKSGVKGYSYLVDNDESGSNLDTTIDTIDSFIVVNKDSINWGQKVYFHIAAIDNAGNASEVSTIELIGDDPAIFYFSPDENNTVLGAFSSTKGIKEFQYPSPDNEEIVIVKSLDSKERIAIDYNLSEQKTIEAKIIFEDDTIYTKNLTIPKAGGK